MRIASVIVDVSARAVDRAFDYSVPDELADGIKVGCAVSVEFGARPVVGYVIALREGEPNPNFKTKPLLGVLSEPYFDEASAELAQWIAHEYLCPLSEALKLMTPPGASPKMKRIDDSWQLVFPGVGPVDDRWVFLTDEAAEFEPRPQATKQIALLEALSCGGMRMAELSLELGSVSSVVSALEKRGVVRVEHRRRMRGTTDGMQASDARLAVLTAGQQDALLAIGEAAARSRGRMLNENTDAVDEVVVVDGITGSGKTEVYLRAIAQVLALGRGAIVLVPEIALTPQTVGRFRARFGDDVAVLHSRMAAGERFDQWDMVREGAVHVVVGTRSALFAPLHDVGLIIIDEEHDSSYKQDSSPRYSARDVALQLARLRGAALVLGSATPSITTLARCVPNKASELKPWTAVRLTERPGAAQLPSVRVVDMGREFKGGSRSMFSSELVSALLEVYEANEKAVLLLNKRGFASFMLCRECGFVPECPSCSVSLTYHERGNMLVCHHCDHSEPAPARCPKCGSPYLRKFGAGTQRVEDELRAILPADCEIVRMDADTTKAKGAHEALLSKFASTPHAVLLGTQMIAKGLDFADVTLVGVINADTTLKLPDYMAAERTYQLLEQVSGRAGRADKPGRVIVQTYCPDHPAIVAAASHNRDLILGEELNIRAELGYPPYRRLANVLIWGKNERDVRACATELALAINSAVISQNVDCSVLGPAPCILSKLKGDYRWHILLKAPLNTAFADILSGIMAKHAGKRDGVKITVDVDPCNLL